LLPLCLGESLFSTNLYQRQKTLPYEYPDVFAHSQGASLEIYPHVPSGQQHSDLPMWFSATSCFWKTMHHQPVSENCITTDPSQHLRTTLSKDYVDLLIRGYSQHATNMLAQKEISTVILFPDLYTLGDYTRIADALAQPPIHSSFSGGIYAEIYAPKPDLTNEKTIPSSTIWGSKALAITKNVHLRVETTRPLSHLTLNGKQYDFHQESISGIYHSHITQEIQERGDVILFDKSERELWRGYFYPAAKDELLYIDTEEGWRLASPYSHRQPINKEVGEKSYPVWFILIAVLIAIEIFRYRYPLRKI